MPGEESKKHAQEWSDPITTTPSENGHIESGPVNPWFENLLQAERRFEERSRRVALFSWRLSFACLVLVVVSVFVIEADDGMLAEVSRAVLIIAGVSGIVAFFAAAAASMGWLFRSRTPTLKAIERRLAILEQHLLSRS